MLVELDVDGVILGHSERRQLFGETDEALARKVPAALAAGLEPILCVGETLDQREAGETEAVLRRQVEADLAEVPDGRAGQPRDRLRADLGDRHRPQRHPRAGGRARSRSSARSSPAGTRAPALRSGSCTAAPSSRRTRRRCSPPTRSTARSWAAPASTRATSPPLRRPAGDAARGAERGPGPVARPGCAGRLGPGATGAGERGQPGGDASLRRAVGSVSAQHALGQRPRRRPARRPDGELGGRPPQPRCRSRRRAGPDPHRRRGRRRQLLRQPGPQGGVRGGAQRPPRPASPHGTGLRRRRPLRLGAHRGVHRARGARGRAGPRRPRLHRRARHTAQGRSRLPRRARAVAQARRADRHGQWALLRHGSRQQVGSGQEGIRHDRPRRGPPRADGRGSRGGVI